MKKMYLAGLAGPLLLALAACGSSGSGGQGNGSIVAVKQGNYSCADLVFGGLHPNISFPQLMLDSATYSVAGRGGGTYVATGSGDSGTVSFKGGILNGVNGRYSVADSSLTFGGPSEHGDVIADAPGLVCKPA
jgi:hypothetical protein